MARRHGPAPRSRVCRRCRMTSRPRHQLPQPAIHLRPNGHVRYDTVAQVLAAAQRNGVRNLSFFNLGEFGD